MEYVTVTGVEIATVGMDWPASTGDVTVTFENLADAAEAANNDPHIVVPRIKLGHQSEVNGDLMVVNPFAALADAEPAFGRITNLRLENDGAVLVGDYVEVPAWLGDSLVSAYPNRSMEARTDVTTEGGKHYSMVITAVSLLGAFGPAITDLDDLERFLTEGPNKATTEASMAEPIEASISAGSIRERFNFDWATSNPLDDVDTYWWWARDVRVDPNEIIADDDEGNCWSIPFTTDGADEVTFGEPVKVREEFVPIGSAEAVAASVRQRADQRVLASNLARPNKPDPKTAASARPDNEEDTMDPKEIRDSLGLAEDATDEEVIAKGQELREAAETEAPETPETPEVEAEPIAAGAALPEGMVAVPADQWASVQAGAKAGTELAAKSEATRRDETIKAAAEAGKVRPADRESLVNLHATNQAAFYSLLTESVDKGGLAPGLVPVGRELGASHQSDSAQLSAALASFGINRG
jgi:hypothetical protein